MKTYYQIQTRGMNPLTAREYIQVAGDSAKPIFTDQAGLDNLELQTLIDSGVLIIFDQHGLISGTVNVTVEDGVPYYAQIKNALFDEIYQYAARAFATKGAQHGTYTLKESGALCGWLLTAA